MFIADILDICDPVLTFDRIMEEIDVGKYLRERPFWKGGRPGYNRVNMLKTVLFGFMDMGYASLRELEDRCKVDIRYMYLMDYQQPSYNTFRYFIQTELEESAEEIFQAVTKQIFRKEHVDLQQSASCDASVGTNVFIMFYGTNSIGIVNRETAELQLSDDGTGSFFFKGPFGPPFILTKRGMRLYYFDTGHMPPVRCFGASTS